MELSLAMSESHDERCRKAFGGDARLRCKAHLDLVRGGGVNLAGRHCVIVVLRTSSEQGCRTAFLISRRFDHSAVVRNRARRLFRECWRLLLPELKPCWVLMIPRRFIKGAKMGDVMKDLRRLLRKSGVLEASGSHFDGDVESC